MLLSRNPFFIRSSLFRKEQGEGGEYGYGRNPFFIRSSLFHLVLRVIRRLGEVAIPFLSGLLCFLGADLIIEHPVVSQSLFYQVFFVS